MYSQLSGDGSTTWIVPLGSVFVAVAMSSLSPSLDAASRDGYHTSSGTPRVWRRSTPAESAGLEKARTGARSSCVRP